MSLSDRLAQRQARPGQPPGRCRRVTESADVGRRPRRAARNADPFGRREAQRAPGAAGEPRAEALRRAPRPARARTAGHADAAGGAAARRHPDDRGRPGARRAGGRGRDPRPRPPRAVPARPGRLRDHGQRPRPDLRRARRAAAPRSTRRSPTRATCAAPSTRSWPGSAGGSTTPARWWTRGCPTAAGSTPSCRRSRWTARCSRSGSSPPTRFTVDDLISFGTHDPAGRGAAAGLRAGPAEHPDRRRHRLRQDDHAERAVRRSFPTTSASSPSRTRPSCSCARSTCCGWSRARRTSRGAARSRSATWCATRCGCARTASSSARSATAPRSTCCRP